MRIRLLAVCPLAMLALSCTTPEKEALQAARTIQGDWDRCIGEEVDRRFPLVEGEKGLIYLDNEEIHPVFLEVAHHCRAALAPMGGLGGKAALMRALGDAFDRFEEARGRNYWNDAWI